MGHVERRFLGLTNFYASNGFSAPRQISCYDFKPLKQFFVVRTKPESWHSSTKMNHHPSAWIADTQRVSAKFFHDNHPRPVSDSF